MERRGHTLSIYQIAALRTQGNEMNVEPSATPFMQRKRIHVVQTGALVAFALIVFSQSVFNDPATHEAIELIGFGFILVCVFGRLWSILYIGGIKNRELATTGPYSLTRNPLYFFSTLGAFGVGLVIGSFVYAVLLAGLSYLVFRITSKKEANFLRTQFPGEYEAYEKRTPLFWPKISQYIEGDSVEFSPKALKRTFIDALFFIALFPVIELLEYLQATDVLPVLFHVW